MSETDRYLDRFMRKPDPLAGLLLVQPIFKPRPGPGPCPPPPIGFRAFGDGSV